MRYNKSIDKKWQNKWEETELYKFEENCDKEKLYVLEMFSYPSGAKLHAGHWFNYGPVDSWARFKKMRGYNVFQPMGFDAFGLPAENYAIKTGIHPMDSTLKNIDTMKDQLKAMGAMFNWENEVITCSSDYYKWTQWVFLKLFEKGLAYRKNAPVNWCPSCNTVLANEQVVDGSCERCNSLVSKRDLTQWFLKITDYADELLEKIDSLDWPEKTKSMQRHWIGKSKGARVTFKVSNTSLDFDVFTTRVDTLSGVTYIVLAPENPLVDILTTDENKTKVDEYKLQAVAQSDIERQSTTREKTGVFTGSFATHPLTLEKVPIWVGDYVISTYGTGAVMAVPAHDERDYAFAKKYGLPIKKIIECETLPFTKYGKLIDSGEFSGLSGKEAKEVIVKKLEDKNLGSFTTNYRLRDWLVSRQRYWGAPIPIIYCEDCGTVPVPEKDLPVELPYDVEFTPDGKSPLAKCEEFVNTTCPCCNKPAKREVDTLDTFVCSSFYYLRYVDNKNAIKAWDVDKVNSLLPVDKYVGGPEHACMHLLYARFITKAFRDMGLLNFDEPFTSLVHQGLILGSDGLKMSKSKGNTISPDEYVQKYGSDVFRMYLMFGFDYTEGGPWSDDAIKSMSKFVERVERYIEASINLLSKDGRNDFNKIDKDLNFVRHNTIKSILIDMDKFQFNTCIARMMELTNALSKYLNEEINPTFLKKVITDFIKLLSPFAPHFSEELWEQLGNTSSVFNEEYPTFDEKALIKDEIEIAIQISGKIKAKITVASDLDIKAIEDAALNNKDVKKAIGDKEIVKVIVIKGRLINIVVK